MTLQLITLRRPMAVLLNMADEARRKGIRIDAAKLSRRLGVPVHLVSARTGEGLNFPLVGEVSEILVPDSTEGRYRLARALTSDTAVCSDSTERQGMDRLLLHPFWGLPFFFLIMGTVFLITFQWAGPWLSRGMDLLTDKLRNLLSGTSLDVPAITDGLLSSAGYVLSFLPCCLLRCPLQFPMPLCGGFPVFRLRP